MLQQSKPPTHKSVLNRCFQMCTVDKAMTLIPLRKLRIIQWVGGQPYRAVCTRCERSFTLTDSTKVSVEAARDNLEHQFGNHSCEQHHPMRKTA